MPNGNLERLIGTALIDQEFRSALLLSPVAAAAGFGLTEEESQVLGSTDAKTLEELAGYIHAWSIRMRNPRRTASPRWISEGLQAARAAG